MNDLSLSFKLEQTEGRWRVTSLSDDSFSSTDVEPLITFYAPANDITALFFFFLFPSSEIQFECE